MDRELAARRARTGGLVSAGALALLAFASHARAATITVTTTTDEYGSGAACSLREAVQSSNAAANFGGCTHTGTYGIDTIHLPPGTYNLSIFGVSENANATGDLDILGNVTISATGATPTIRSIAGWDDRLIHVQAGGVAMTKKVTMGIAQVGGSTAGGCLRIESGAALSLLSSGVANCSAGGNAGAILNIGALYITNTNIFTSTANGADGGGAIYSSNSSVLSISNSVLRANQTTDTLAQGGAIHCDPSSNVTIVDSTIENNTATSGGGIACTSATLSIQRSTIRNNRGQLSGGLALAGSGMNATIVDSLISGNNAIKDRATDTVVVIAGGGVNFCCGTLMLTHSIVRDNTVRNDRIENNTPRGGGLALAGHTVIRDSTISGNSVSGGLGDSELSGGGINALTGGTGFLTLINSTVSNNTAEGGGGGIFLDDAFNVWLYNTTVARNSGKDGGGIRITAGGQVTVTNSAFAANADTGANNRDDCFGAVKKLSFSHMTSTTGCTFVSGIPTTGSSGLVTTLANNGGTPAGDSTSAEVPRTHRPASGSIVIDAGDPSGCDDPAGGSLTTDQRGIDRPLGATGIAPICDVGAVELHYPGLDVTKIASRYAISPATAARSVVYTITLQNTDPLTITEYVVTDTLHPVMQWDTYPATCSEVVYNKLVCTLASNTAPGQSRTITGTASFVGVLAPGSCGDPFVNNVTASAEGFDGPAAASLRSASASTTYLCLQRVYMPNTKRGDVDDW